MARYTGPAWRLSRREKLDLFPRSSQGSKSKFAERSDVPPGMHGQTRQKLSDYGLQLREKQKVKRIYGVLERQFRNYYQKASRSKGVTGGMLLSLLERRLDNVIYRMGVVNSRRQARQAVSHGHALVNGKKIDIPSYEVKLNDVVTLKPSEKMAEFFKASYEKNKDVDGASWIDVNIEKLEAKIKKMPERSDIQMPIQEQLIVELYSK